MGFYQKGFPKYLTCAGIALQFLYSPSSQAFSTFGRLGLATSSYKVNPVNQDMTDAQALNAVKASADIWGQQGGANFSFQYGGPTTKANISMDNENIVFFRNTAEPSLAIAVTYSWMSTARPNEITEYDIIFFDGGYQFFANGMTCTGSGQSVESVGVHEFGHALGLDHSNIRPSTMYPTVRACDLAPQRLTSDDIAAIQSIYGPSGRTPASSPTPVPSATPRPSATPMPTATPVASATPMPTATPRPSATPAPSATPVPPTKGGDNGPGSAPTPNPTPAATPAPSATPPVKENDPTSETPPGETPPTGTPCPGRNPPDAGSSPAPGGSGMKAVSAHACGSDFAALISQVQNEAAGLRNSARIAFLSQSAACGGASNLDKSQMMCRNTAEANFVQAIRQINFDEQANVDLLMEQAGACPETNLPSKK